MKLSIVFVSILVCACDLYNAQDCQPSVLPPDPQSGCCGRALTGTTRRVGSFVEVNEYPWMGVIEYKNRKKNIENANAIGLYCSAVLISSRYVLTGAVCLNPPPRFEPINVRLGEYDTNNEGPDCVGDEAKPGQRICTDGAISIPIEQSFKHPEYNFRTKQDDIGVIKLAQTAPYTNSVRPICLPTLDVTVRPPEPFYMAVAGWGAVNSTTLTNSNVLRQVLVPYVKPSICWPKYSGIPRIVLTDRQICAGSKNRDSCRGDSGGPLMYKKKNVTEVAGLVSYGKGCGSDVPGIYTKVYAYKEWIIKVIQEEEAKVSTTTIDTDTIYFRENF